MYEYVWFKPSSRYPDPTTVPVIPNPTQILVTLALLTEVTHVLIICATERIGLQFAE